MATQIQHRRGTTVGHASFTGAAGEITVDTDKDILIVHDGATAAGFPVVSTTATQTMTNKTLTSPVLNTGVSGTAFLDEDTMSSNSATKLASQQSIKAYVDAQVTAQDLDFIADSGGALNIDLDSESLTIAGGTGLASVGSLNTVTLNIDSTVGTLTGTQTMTNKTLTSPTINAATVTGVVDLTGGVLSGASPLVFEGLTANGFETTIAITDPTADRTWTIPNASDTFVGLATTDTLTNKSLTSPTITGIPTVPTASSATNSTQVASTAYVTTAVTNLIGGAPGALDTLNELAEAIGDDASYAATITTALGTKVATSSAQALATSANAMTISGSVITLNRGDGTTDTVTAPNDNTTYSAGAGLDISGTTFSVEPDLRDSITHIGLDAGDYIGWTNNLYQSFFVNAAERVRIEADGDLHADGDVIAYSTTISDERLKTGIMPITNALAKVNQLKGCTFTYTADGKKSAGLIAQDVEKVLPSAVSEKELPLKKDDGEKYKVLQYDQTIGLLVEAIKELSSKIEELEEK